MAKYLTSSTYRTIASPHFLIRDNNAFESAADSFCLSYHVSCNEHIAISHDVCTWLCQLSPMPALSLPQVQHLCTSAHTYMHTLFTYSHTCQFTSHASIPTSHIHIHPCIHTHHILPRMHMHTLTDTHAHTSYSPSLQVDRSLSLDSAVKQDWLTINRGGPHLPSTGITRGCHAQVFTGASGNPSLREPCPEPQFLKLLS